MDDRQKDILVFVCAFVGLVAAGLIQVSAGSALWEAEKGLIFSTMDLAATFLPGNRDVPVSLLTGMISGLLLLFLADCTKRLQLLAMFIILIFIGVFLNVSDNVVSTVMSEPLFYLIPLILTVFILPIVTRFRVSGPPTVTDYGRRLQLLRFPAATTILYLILVLLIGIVTVQYTLIRPEAESQLLPYEGLPAILVVSSGIVAVLSLAVFLGFRREMAVMTISEDNTVEVDVVGSLYNEARRRYFATPEPSSKDDLNDAIQGEARTPKSLAGSRFRYLPPGKFRRPVILSVDGTNINDVNRVLQKEDASGEVASIPVRAIRGMGEAMLRPLRNPFSATSVEVSEANQLVLLTEYPAEKSEQTIEQLGDVFSLYDQLANPNRTENSISTPENTKIVVANSNRADEEEPLNKHTIARQISRDFEDFDTCISLDIDRDRDDDTVITVYSDDFFPVTGQGNDMDTRGFDELLRQL